MKKRLWVMQYVGDGEEFYFDDRCYKIGELLGDDDDYIAIALKEENAQLIIDALNDYKGKP